MRTIVIITHLMPTAATHGATAKMNAVLNVLRITVTPTNASPIIYIFVSYTTGRWRSLGLHLGMSL